MLSILVYKYKLKNTKLLIAKGIDENITEEVDSFMNDVLKYASQKGVIDNLVLHSWLPQEIISEYYSLGTVTLCIGDIVEAFSNTTVESLSCETPVIASNIACYRSTFSNTFVDKVNIHDSDQVARIIMKKYIGREKTSERRSYVIKYFDNKTMCKRYFDVLHAIKGNPKFLFSPSTAISRVSKFKLSPWCSFLKGQIYNEYSKILYPEEELVKLLSEEGQAFTKDQAVRYNITVLKLKQMVNNGILIPTN